MRRALCAVLFILVGFNHPLVEVPRSKMVNDADERRGKAVSPKFRPGSGQFGSGSMAVQIGPHARFMPRSRDRRCR